MKSEDDLLECELLVVELNLGLTEVNWLVEISVKTKVPPDSQNDFISSREIL